MSDPFIDALHARLSSSAGARVPGGQDDDTPALTAWWNQFVDVIGQKVGAWNERQAPRPAINFTKHPNGDVHVWHRSAEVMFARDGNGSRVSTRLGAAPPRSVTVALRVGPDGSVVALAGGAELSSATATAEHFLTPVLIETFATP